MSTLRIDAHQHFIDYATVDYPWIDDRHGALKRPFMPADLKPLLDSMSFNGSIAVQARQSLHETEWLLSLADEFDFVYGVVGWVDLCSPAVSAQLESFGAHPKLKGIRHVIQDEPDDRFMLRDDFLHGLSLLGRYGLTYDLLLFERHLPNASILTQMFPEQKFVLDHLAKPRIMEGQLDSWRSGIQELAKSPNVYCKLSGMVTEADWANWREEDFVPYLDTVFEAFGPDRLMIGSDWPVCTVSRDYRAVMNVVITYINQLPTEIQDRILGGNCARFYNIDEM
ncbi:amidohydrolase family protein [Paenibacillus shunpengii]|uniref:Amidohydrolase family protein n=1 Tax=Paenibacillus shunpengii TaxID=2054424 RepID=A0ABW5SN11_9BACL